MEDLLLKLEKKIKELIGQHDSLKHTNHLLNQGKQVLSLEKEALLARQQKAALQIEKLVSRLKTLGSDYE